MFQQLVNNYIQPKKDKVSDILFDIELFYCYLQQYGQIIENWYFQNVFRTNYWGYLENYRWLTTKQQNFLHQGILSILLFKCYQHLENTSKINESDIGRIKYSVNSFHPNTLLSKRLKTIVEKAITMVENGTCDNSENELLESITWTLKNIVLKN